MDVRDQLQSRPGWRTAVGVWWPATATLLALAVGGVLAFAGRGDLADWLWGATIAAAGLSMLVEVVRGLARREPGVDVIALLALIGAILLGELLAGVIIAVMLTGGRALEDFAEARARKELTALVTNAPRTAYRRQGGQVVEVGAEEVLPGDPLVVRPGEAVPVDGILASGRAVLDESALTGEARPVEREEGDRLASGAVNAGGPLELRATARAADSTYAGLVRLVEQAQAERAPFVRLADRTAGWFVPLTLAVAGGAWFVSGDPVRALAVLVVATPCPLILATPIAITSGISRLARRGVIVKGGGALETLGRVQTVLLDKTGTITRGRPTVLDVVAFGDADADEVLALAASLDQLSAHVFAPTIVQAARARDLPLAFPNDVEEHAGAGIRGWIRGEEVRVGRAGWVTGGPLPAAGRAVRRRTAVEGTSAVFVGRSVRPDRHGAGDGNGDGARRDGGAVEPLGALILDDPLRVEAGRTIRGLRRHGVARVVMLTGDHADVAELVGEAVDVDRVLAERSPQDKVDAVREARGRAVTLMVGDGVNDAPALAHAHVGIAMGAAGATASSEAADVVITVDDFERVRESLAVAQRTRRIAWQSIAVGMGLAILAMGFAAVGLLPPVAGALVQEGIDVVAILNALRALRGRATPPPRPELAEISNRVREEHRRLRGSIDQLRRTAERLPALSGDDARAALDTVRRFLVDRLVPHEIEEGHDVYPLMAEAADGEDPTAPLRHTHREIVRLVRLLDDTVRHLPPGGPAPDDVPELQRMLYGLHAILRLHLAQEDEALGILDAASSERVLA